MLRNVLFLWWNTPVKSVQIYQTIFLPFELICRVKIIKYHILTIFWRYNWSFIQYSKDRQLIFPVLFTDIFLILSFVFFKHLITAQRSIIYLTWLSTQCWCHCCVHVAKMEVSNTLMHHSTLHWHVICFLTFLSLFRTIWLCRLTFRDVAYIAGPFAAVPLRVNWLKTYWTHCSVQWHEWEKTTDWADEADWLMELHTHTYKGVWILYTRLHY